MGWSWTKIFLVFFVFLILILLIVWACCWRKGGDCNTKSSCDCGQDDCNTCGSKKKKQPKCAPPPCPEPCKDVEECCPSNVCKLLDKLNQRVCRAEQQSKYALQQLNVKITNVDTKRDTIMGAWSLNLDGRQSAQPGTINNQPMLFASVVPHTSTVVTDSQIDSSSIQQVPWDAVITALTVQINSPLTAGSMSFTVTIDGVPILLTTAYTTLTQSFVTMYPAAPGGIPITKDQFLGIAFSSSGATLTSTPATFTAQIFGRYNP